MAGTEVPREPMAVLGPELSVLTAGPGLFPGHATFLKS